MNSSDAKNLKMNFRKHKDKNLKDFITNDNKNIIINTKNKNI